MAHSTSFRGSGLSQFVPITANNPLTWTLREIARLERGGMRPPRLTEPDFERWQRVRRKLGWVAFIVVAARRLVEDAAEPDDSDPFALVPDDLVARNDLHVSGRGKKKRFQLVPRGVSS